MKDKQDIFIWLLIGNIIIWLLIGIIGTSITLVSYTVDKNKCYNKAKLYNSQVIEYSFVYDYCFIDLKGQRINLENYRVTNN